MDLFVTKQGERIKELEEELSSWVSQYGCECGHPRCNRCRDTREANEVLNKAKIHHEEQFCREIELWTY